MNNALGRLCLSSNILNPARNRGMRRMSSILLDPIISYKVGFMFPGQGAQLVGMAGSLCNEIPEAKQLFDRASDILSYDLLQKCVDGPKDALDSTVISQPAIFVSSMACVEKLRKENPAAIDSCTVAMGLSLGEYSALCFAGAFSFEDGVRLTKARGEAMQAASDTCQSGMVAVIGLDSVAVQKICEAAAARSGEPIGIANYLSEGNYAVSGGKAACAAVIELAPSMGARMAVPLAVAGAFHTAYMQPAVASLRTVLEAVDIRTPRIPVIANVDATAHYEPADIRSALVRQVTSPVRWESTMRAMLTSPDFETAYELGPGSVCRAIVKRFNKRASVVGVQA